MKILMFFRRLLVGLCFLGVFHQASASIMNGGFETGDLSDWTVTNSASVGVFPEISGVICCKPSEGLYFAAFNRGGTSADGEISQSFATTMGMGYTLAFDFGKAGTSAGTAALDISILGAGTLLNTSVSDSVGGAPGAFSTYLFSFIADSLTTTLSFSDASTGSIASYDALLDNVSVSAVPIPATFWLFGAAIIGLAGLGRRRKET